MMKWLKLEYYLIYTGMMKEMDSWVRNEKILIKGLLYWDWEEVSIYEYEKDKDITMLVCSLGFEYKYLNINKVMEVPTRIEWIRDGR